jgi:hypothetical protein
MEHRNSKKDHIKYVMEKSCINKKSFSEEKANQVVDFFATKKDAIYFYKCDFCGSHHLTRRKPNMPKVLKIL